MKHVNFYITLFIGFMSVFGFAGCASDDVAGPDPNLGPEITRMWIEGGLNTSVGGTQELRAFVLLADGTKRDITDDASWDTLDPAVAIADKGNVTGVAIGVTQVRIRYRGVTFTDFLGVPNRGNPQGSISLEGFVGVEQALTFDYSGETRQLQINIRYPDATRMDITDRVTWEVSNPEAISVDEYGMATVHVAQGASELYVSYRGHFAPFTLQVGDPLPKEYDVIVEAFSIAAPYSCDSENNLDGGDGEFCYQINVISPDGSRLLVAETPDYPNRNHVIELEQNGSLLLESPQLHLALSEIQTLEIEVRVTEWDLQWVDFGDPIHDSDMDDMRVTRVYRGSNGFSPGVHKVLLEGATADCEVEVGYRIIAIEK